MLTDAQIHQWVIDSQEFVRSTFEKRGRVLPFAIVLGSYNPVTKKEERGIFQVYSASGFGEEEKAAFAAKVKELCRNHRAAAVMFISEVWAVIDMTEEEHRAYKRKHSSLEHAPGRREAIMVTVERRGSSQGKLWFAEIMREGNNATLGPFHNPAPEAEKIGIGGRFANLLQNDSIQ